MSLSALIAAVVIILIAAALSLSFLIRGQRGTIALPYQRAKALFSPAERAFLDVLEHAAGPECRIFGKVRVADVATVAPGLTPSARQAALNRIAGKHFDYIVCQRDNLAILCAIELNDSSHASAKARARDAFLADVCRVIGLPLVPVKARSSYDANTLRDQLLAALSSR